MAQQQGENDPPNRSSEQQSIQELKTEISSLKKQLDGGVHGFEDKETLCTIFYSNIAQFIPPSSLFLLFNELMI